MNQNVSAMIKQKQVFWFILTEKLISFSLLCLLFLSFNHFVVLLLQLMLPELLAIAKQYVVSFSIVHLFQAYISKPRWGDIMIRNGDETFVYFAHDNKWTIMKPGDCKIWIVNPENGYFIYANYYKYIIGISVVFDHKKYIFELLNNLDIIITTEYKMGNLFVRIFIETCVILYGHKHHIYFESIHHCRYVPVNSLVKHSKPMLNDAKKYITSKPFLVSNMHSQLFGWMRYKKSTKIEDAIIGNAANIKSYEDILVDKHRTIFVQLVT
jgi:hypothetical protein